MFLLNMLFEIGNEKGNFALDSTTILGPLGTSRNWLKLKNAIEPEPINPNPPAFDPERSVIWEDLSEADTLLIPGPSVAPPDPANIAIRIAHRPDLGVALVNPVLQLVVSFGKSVKAQQKFGSPFLDSAGVATLTTFILGPTGPIAPNTSGGWFLPLGTIAKRPGKPNKTHRYEFSIGITVTEGPASARRTRHYGDDPDMDVGM